MYNIENIGSKSNDRNKRKKRAIMWKLDTKECDGKKTNIQFSKR